MPNLHTSFSPQLLASAIKAKRTGMMLRIVDVAEALELSRQTIIKVEQGDTSVNFSNLLKIMGFLGLSWRITTDDDAFNNTGSQNNEWY